MYSAPPTVTLPERFQALADAIWLELLAACDAYFCRHETLWAGHREAPEFTDEQVQRQFEYWDEYRTDSGAMNWGESRTKELAYDFTALPPAWQRGICERVWVLCRDAGLWENEAYRALCAKRRAWETEREIAD